LQKKLPRLTEGVGKGVGEKVGKRVGETLSAKDQEILNLIGHDPEISAKRIASGIGISTRKTEDHLRKLQIAGFLRRVGPRRGGHWEVLIQ
jgi:ATP-dependent DNA helicase RecG